MNNGERLRAAFGQLLREQRQEAGLSQERLAELAELHRNYVGLVERGVNAPSLTAVAALAHALDMRPSELIREAEERAGLWR